MNGVWARTPAVDERRSKRRILLAQETLKRRALPGLFVYLGVCLGYGVLVVDLAVAVTATLLLTIGLLRLGLLRRGDSMMIEAPERWRAIFGGLALASMVTWDGFTAFEIWRHDLDAASIMLLAASYGLRAHATHSLSPDLRILNVYSLVSRVPVFVALVIVASRLGYVVIALTALQTIYGLVLGRQLNLEFWTAVEASEKLEQEIETRERVEIELRLAQKLESVGRLAAGIAHEINTPLQAVMGSLSLVSEGVTELFSFVEEYRNGYRSLGRGEPAPAATIAAEANTEDLQYLTDHLPEACELAHESLNRTAAIVKSMREFAHPDGQVMAPVDLNRALETTLAISRHTYNTVATIELDLAHALPAVVCHAGELNQVFLGIIVNAAQAIGAAGARAKGRITIRSRATPADVTIMIADTGTGIPLAIRDRVFDPFFTTRPPGKGSGQGLTIARSVIDRYGGELRFDTEVGVGTTFWITVPIAATASERRAA
ncbi:hypothetical protein BH11MYX1_BH11MYX1_18760 [soil metagenome]